MEGLRPSNQSVYKPDYTSAKFSLAFKTDKPVIYKDGVCYCCISGPNTTEGIFGFGNSPEESIADWDKAYAKRNGII